MTPPNASTTPASREPVTRWLRSIERAKSAVKSGAEALKIAASPESMYCWPQAIRKNGTAVLISASSASGRAYGRSCAKPWPAACTKTASASAPKPIRKRISVEGARSRRAIVMNMKDEPQIAASAPSIRRWRRLTLSPNAAADVGLPNYTESPDRGRRSAHRCCSRPSRARPHGRGAGPHRRAARSRAEPLRAGGLLAALVGALRLQAFGPPAETTSL